jgi:transposase
MAATHQVCLAHVLRDVQYVIDSGDNVFAPPLAKLLAWTIDVGRRRRTAQGQHVVDISDQG